MKAEIIQKAEKLFFKNGYRSVALQDLASELGIKPASLYYHFKGGKEEIYLAVIQSRAASFKTSIESIAFRTEGLENVLLEFGYWYLVQPPMNMSLIAEFDMPHLSARGRRIAMEAIGANVFAPLGQLFTRFSPQLRPDFNPMQLVGTFSVLLNSVRTSSKMSGMDSKKSLEYVVRLFLHGAQREGSA